MEKKVDNPTPKKPEGATPLQFKNLDKKSYKQVADFITEKKLYSESDGNALTIFGTDKQISEARTELKELVK